MFNLNRQTRKQIGIKQKQNKTKSNNLRSCYVHKTATLKKIMAEGIELPSKIPCRWDVLQHSKLTKLTASPVAWLHCKNSQPDISSQIHTKSLWQAPILNSDIVCYFWNYINNANYRHYDKGKLWLDVLPKILTPSPIFLKFSIVKAILVFSSLQS